MRTRFLAQARAEFDAAIDYYEHEASGLGFDFLFEVEQVVASALEHPEIGAPHVESTRRLLLPRFPYSVIYFVGESEIAVVAIAHHRREPGYWMDRI